MNIVLIPTRIDSNRLPGKANFKICKYSLLDYVIYAAQNSKTTSFTGLITTNRPNDMEFIKEYSEKCFTFSWDGNVNDVLGRFVAAVEHIEELTKAKIENIVRFTHDCPLLAFHTDLIDKVIENHIENDCDFSHNKSFFGYPSGLDVEVMTKDTLIDINNYANDKEREHVTLCIKNNSNKYKIGELEIDTNGCNKYENLLNHKWSIDNADDFIKVSDVIKMYCLKGVDIFEKGTDIFERIKNKNEFKIKQS